MTHFSSIRGGLIAVACGVLFGAGVAYAQIPPDTEGFCECQPPNVHAATECAPGRSYCCACGTFQSEAVCCPDGQTASCHVSTLGDGRTVGNAECQ